MAMTIGKISVGNVIIYFLTQEIIRDLGNRSLSFEVARKRAVEQYLSTNGPVAQRLEQGTHNPLVLGSNPSGPTIKWIFFIHFIIFSPLGMESS